MQPDFVIRIDVFKTDDAVCADQKHGWNGKKMVLQAGGFLQHGLKLGSVVQHLGVHLKRDPESFGAGHCVVGNKLVFQLILIGGRC